MGLGPTGLGIQGQMAPVRRPEDGARLCADRERGAKERLVLDPECLAFRAFEVVGGANLARGEGELYFDSRINFRFNAGPLERVQGVLGPIGEVLGGVTDALMKYHVTGTLAEPKTAVKPLGIGTK